MLVSVQARFYLWIGVLVCVDVGKFANEYTGVRGCAGVP